MLHNSLQRNTRIKSWVSFEIFRKFSLWWALKFSNLGQSEVRKPGLKWHTLLWKIITRAPFYINDVTQKIRLMFKGPKHLHFWAILKCVKCGGALKLSCPWLSNEHWNFVPNSKITEETGFKDAYPSLKNPLSRRPWSLGWHLWTQFSQLSLVQIGKSQCPS